MKSRASTTKLRMLILIANNRMLARLKRRSDRDQRDETLKMQRGSPEESEHFNKHTNDQICEKWGEKNRKIQSIKQHVQVVA